MESRRVLSLVPRSRRRICKYSKKEKKRREKQIKSPTAAASSANQPTCAYPARPKAAELSCTTAVEWRCRCAAKQNKQRLQLSMPGGGRLGATDRASTMTAVSRNEPDRTMPGPAILGGGKERLASV